MIVPIGGVHRAVVEAFDYARSLSPDVRAVYVDVDAKVTEEVRHDWEQPGAEGCGWWCSSRRTVRCWSPLSEYIEQVEREPPDDFLTLLLPEFVPAQWWQHLLHNQNALLIKGALLFKRNVVVTSVPFHLTR